MRTCGPRSTLVARSAFVGFRFPPEVIVLAVRWYLRFGLSYRDIEELLAERGVEVDHVTIYRWVLRFTPLLADAARPCRHAFGDRWQVDETHVKVAGVLPLPISSLKSAFLVLGNPANRERTVPLTYDQFRYSFANAVSEDEAKQLYEDFAVPTPGKLLFQAAAGQPESLDRGQGRPQEPRPRAAAVYLRRAGPHRPVGDRQRLLQAAAGQPRRDRDRQEQEPRSRPDHRQQLA